MTDRKSFSEAIMPFCRKAVQKTFNKRDERIDELCRQRLSGNFHRTNGKSLMAFIKRNPADKLSRLSHPILSVFA
ncbi:MAG: hypothetical protein AB1757_26070 [Acidobacteriota bacterium]